MKILTKRQLGRVKRLALVADAFIGEALLLTRNAHRSWRLTNHLKGARTEIVRMLDEMTYNESYHDPPQTRKVERMEKMESP